MSRILVKSGGYRLQAAEIKVQLEEVLSDVDRSSQGYKVLRVVRDWCLQRHPLAKAEAPSCRQIFS